MKKKEKTSVQSMKLEELKRIITETKAAIAKLKVNRYSKQSKNTREVTAMRRKLAIVSTVAQEKELIHE